MRAAYEASRALAASSGPKGRAPAKEVAAFVASMPARATRRNLLVKALREVEAGREPEGQGPVKDRPTPGKER